MDKSHKGINYTVELIDGVYQFRHDEFNGSKGKNLPAYDATDADLAEATAEFEQWLDVLIQSQY